MIEGVWGGGGIAAIIVIICDESLPLLLLARFWNAAVLCGITVARSVELPRDETPEVPPAT